MRHPTLECNQPHFQGSPLADSPETEIAAAAADRAQIHAGMLEQIADVARLANQLHTKMIRCECGLSGFGESECLFIRSPRTSRIASLSHLYANDLPPRVRSRIVRAEGSAEFSPFELQMFHEASVKHAPPAFTPHQPKGRRW